MISSSTTVTDDYSSALEIDSSDLEFYDFSDEESIQTITPLDKVTASVNKIKQDLISFFLKVLADIDKTFDVGTLSQILVVLEQLKDLNIEYPDNPELLWRLGKAHYKVSEKSTSIDEKKEHIGKGK